MLHKRTKPRDKGKAAGTRSKVRKGPARDEGHLERLRRQPCIGWGRGKSYPASVPISEAHHVRCIAPRTLGKRVSDYLAVPLCSGCHALLHKGKEEDFWHFRDVDPRDFIRSFSEEGRQAIAELQKREGA